LPVHMAVVSAYREFGPRSGIDPVWVKEAMDGIHSSIQSIRTDAIGRPMGVSDREILALVPVLARVATGEFGEESARVAADKFMGMWLKSSDRAEVHRQLLREFNSRGDRYGHLLRAIYDLTRSGTSYDAGVHGSPEERRRLVHETREFFRAVAADNRARFAAAGADDSVRRDAVRLEFQALQARGGLEAFTTTILRRERSHFSDVLPEDFAQHIPRLSRQAQDMLHAMSPLLQRLAYPGDHPISGTKADFDQLAELASQLAAEGGLPAETKREFQEWIAQRATLILGRGPLTERIEAALPRMSVDQRRAAFDMCRLAQRLATPEGIRAASVADVLAISRFSSAPGMVAVTDKLLAGLLSGNASCEVKASAFQYFRMIGWQPERDGDRIVSNAVQQYAREYIRQGNTSDKIPATIGSFMTPHEWSM
jgi:hypothetical protein